MGSQDRETARLVPETGDTFVDSCFQAEFLGSIDAREWPGIPGTQSIANASNQGRYEEALRLLGEFERLYPDFWFTYYWYAVVSRTMGRLDDARDFCLRGLQSSKSKFDLCAMLGIVEWESGHIEEAVRWWIRSATVQVHDRKLLNDDPFLHLSYVADALNLVPAAIAFRRVVDAISPLVKPRLNDDSARRLFRASRISGTESMRRAVELLSELCVTSYPELGRKASS